MSRNWLGEAVTPQEIGSGVEREKSNSEATIGSLLIKHKFRLRRDLEIEFRLPENFSKAEAARLADFIGALPFDE